MQWTSSLSSRYRDRSRRKTRPFRQLMDNVQNFSSSWKTLLVASDPLGLVCSLCRFSEPPLSSSVKILIPVCLLSLLLLTDALLQVQARVVTPLPMFLISLDDSLRKTCDRISRLSKRLIETDWAKNNPKLVYKKSNLGILLDVHLQFALEPCVVIQQLIGHEQWAFGTFCTKVFNLWCRE